MEKYLNLRVLVISNTLDMLLYMAIISWLCGGITTGASCIKTWNMTFFVFQLLLNFALCGWLIQQKKRDFQFLWITIFWLALSFFIFSSLQG